jgi:hypothetical protein
MWSTIVTIVLAVHAIDWDKDMLIAKINLIYCFKKIITWTLIPYVLKITMKLFNIREPSRYSIYSRFLVDETFFANYGKRQNEWEILLVVS